MPNRAGNELVVYTIGHSTRSLDELIALLAEHGIERLADVRTVPRSARNPQFNREALPGPLANAGIAYAHLPELGGLRHARKDSANTGWRNASFRGYADYMQTPQFEASLAGLIELASRQRTAIMCAEAVPWRCHRSLISDALAVRSVQVMHIVGRGRAQAHCITPFAHVEGTCVTYPGEPLLR
jgi:uncharacterized protein (DUF488 family)